MKNKFRLRLYIRQVKRKRLELYTTSCTNEKGVNIEFKPAF